MRKIILAAILIVGIVSTYSFAQMQRGMMGQGMMGYGSPVTGSQELEESGETPDTRGNYTCQMMGPGYGGHMMGRGMMGGCGMGQGMAGYGKGCGMMGPGYGGHMMGRGMMGGCGMGPGMMGYGYYGKQHQKFLDETVDLRREIHNKRFDYLEAVRNPDTERETVLKMDKEIRALQDKLYEKSLK